MTERVEAYASYLTEARTAFTQTDNSGWKLANLTWHAVTELMDSGLNKEQSLLKWSEDLERDGFSLSSARRYFTVWDRHSETRLTRDMPDGRELSFAEHYAAVKGGRQTEQNLRRGQSMRAAARTPEMVSDQAAARHAAALESAHVDLTDSGSDTEDLAQRIDAATAAMEWVMAWVTVHDGLTDDQVKEFEAFHVDIQKMLNRITEFVPVSI